MLLGKSSLVLVIVWDSGSDAFNAAMPAAASQARHCSSMFVNTLQVLTDPSALDHLADIVIFQDIVTFLLVSGKHH